MIIKVDKKTAKRLQRIKKEISNIVPHVEEDYIFHTVKKTIKNLNEKLTKESEKSIENLHKYGGLNLLCKYTTNGRSKIKKMFEKLFVLNEDSICVHVEKPWIFNTTTSQIMKTKILKNVIVNEDEGFVDLKHSILLSAKLTHSLARVIELKEKHIKKLKKVSELTLGLEIYKKYVSFPYRFVLFPSNTQISHSVILKKYGFVAFGFIESSSISSEIIDKGLSNKLIEMGNFIQSVTKLNVLKELSRILSNPFISLAGVIIYIPFEEAERNGIKENDKSRIGSLIDLTMTRTFNGSGMSKSYRKFLTETIKTNAKFPKTYRNVAIPLELFVLKYLDFVLDSLDFEIKDEAHQKRVVNINKESKEEEERSEGYVSISSFIRKTIRDIFKDSYKEAAVTILSKKIEGYVLRNEGSIDEMKKRARTRLESIKRKFDRILNKIKNELKEVGLSNGEANNAIGNVIVPLILYFQKYKEVIEFIEKMNEGTTIKEHEIEIFDYVKNHPIAWQSLSKLTKTKLRVSEKKERGFIDAVKQELSKYFEDEFLLAAVHTIRILNAKGRIGKVYLSNETIASDITKATKLSSGEVESLFLQMIRLGILNKSKEGRSNWFGISINPSWLAHIRNNK